MKGECNMVGMIIDISLLVIAVILVIRHAKVGFIKSVLDTLKAFIAAGLAFVLRAPVARLIDTSFMRNMANGWVYNSLVASANGADPAFDLVSLYNDCPMAYTVLLSKFGLNTEGLGDKLNNLESLTNEEITGLAEEIGGPLSWICSVAIAMLAIFIVAIILLTVIIYLLNFVSKLPVIKFLNRFLGAVIGLAWAALLAFGVGVVITLGSTFLPETIPPTIISESIILSALANIDVFEIVSKFSS